MPESLRRESRKERAVQLGRLENPPISDSHVANYAAIPLPTAKNPVDSLCQTPLKASVTACHVRSGAVRFPEILVIFRKFAPVSTERSDATSDSDRTGSTAADRLWRI